MKDKLSILFSLKLMDDDNAIKAAVEKISKAITSNGGAITFTSETKRHNNSCLRITIKFEGDFNYYYLNCLDELHTYLNAIDEIMSYFVVWDDCDKTKLTLD